MKSRENGKSQIPSAAHGLQFEDLYSTRHALAEATAHLTDADIAALSVWFGPSGPRGRLGSE